MVDIFLKCKSVALIFIKMCLILLVTMVSYLNVNFWIREMLRQRYLMLLLGFGLNFSYSQVFAQVNRTTEKNIPFQICSEAKNWVRPSATKQKEYLTGFKSRYSNEQVNTLGGKYWTYNIFAFVNYPGGSGIFDINNLSGLWNLKKGDATENKKCNPISSIEGNTILI